MLALTTISDGFVYLMLQEKSATAAGYFPLFYVMTAAAAYMLFAIPAGRLADRTSRAAVFIGGYIVLVALYRHVVVSNSRPGVAHRMPRRTRSVLRHQSRGFAALAASTVSSRGAPNHGH